MSAAKGCFRDEGCPYPLACEVSGHCAKDPRQPPLPPSADHNEIHRLQAGLARIVAADQRWGGPPGRDNRLVDGAFACIAREALRDIAEAQERVDRARARLRDAERHLRNQRLRALFVVTVLFWIALALWAPR